MNTKVAKKQNNKGFTLIELIVVIAIIAVLAAILAPQYLRYVEKSRVSADQSSAKELLNATQTACAEENVYTKLDAGTSYVHWNGTTISASPAELQTALTDTFSKVPEIKSQAYKDKTYEITFQIDKDAAKVTCDGDFVDTPTKGTTK